MLKLFSCTAINIYISFLRNWGRPTPTHLRVYCRTYRSCLVISHYYALTTNFDFAQKLNMIIMKAEAYVVTSIFYPRDAMLARVIVIATCLSVCPSRAGIVSKRRKLASWFLHHLVATRFIPEGSLWVPTDKNRRDPAMWVQPGNHKGTMWVNLRDPHGNLMGTTWVIYPRGSRWVPTDKNRRDPAMWVQPGNHKGTMWVN